MRFFTAFAVPVFLMGCQTTGGTQVSTNTVAQIETGRTDKAAVEAMLGKPTQRNVVGNGEEIWVYRGFQTQSDEAARGVVGTGIWVAGSTVAAAIPVVGGLVAAGAGVASMSGAKTSQESKSLTLTFKKNIVTSCRFATMTSTTTRGVFSVTPTSHSEDVPCSEIRVGSPQQSTQAAAQDQPQ